MMMLEQRQVRKTHLFAPVMLKLISLPRQARDKHGELNKRVAFLCSNRRKQ
jgi:hypothetical protein